MAKIYCKYCNEEFKTMIDYGKHICENPSLKKTWKYKKLGNQWENNRIIEWRKMP